MSKKLFIADNESSESDVELKPKTAYGQPGKGQLPCIPTMSEKLSILDHDSSDSDVELKVNKNYADRYNIWRNKEELQKYKDLKKEDDDSESSSESEEEVPEFDEEFFRALSLLKGKDPRIYDKSYELFTDKEVKKTKATKQKPMFMKDYERSLVLERGGKFSDDEEGEMPAKKFTYDEEQENLKKSFKEALKDSGDEDNDLLSVKTKSKTEEEDEEDDYLKWLKGEEREVSEDIKKDMSHLREYWNDPKLDEGEKFLRDYILNKRYLEKDDSEIPSYEEITSGMLSDDEKIIEEQEKFEHKYNFRFEEPDEEFIKRYPRTIGDSLRKADNRRKQKRDEKAERRRTEREQRKEELKRLKALKRKEIEEKFSKLKEVAGQEELNLNESDLESEFDPDKHEQKMREIFNNDYYEIEEDQKPEFPYDEELDSENWNAWKGEKIVIDGDEKDDKSDTEKNYDLQENATNSKEDFEREMIEATQPKNKVKKKSLFAKVISQPKPIYDPDGKSFDDYLDEYYKLDYEDVIGDMPVRYKYRKVIPNDFGLTVEEILAADDKELNRWCSVKKTCQYRNDDEEIYDVQAYKKKSQNPTAKKKFLSSLFVPKDAENDNNDNINKQINKAKIDTNSNLNHDVNADGLDDEGISSNLEYNVKHQNSSELTKRQKNKFKRNLNLPNSNRDSYNMQDVSDSNQVHNVIEEDTSVAKSKKQKKNNASDTNQLNVKLVSSSSNKLHSLIKKLGKVGRFGEEDNSSDYDLKKPSVSTKRKNENLSNETVDSENDASEDLIVKKKRKLKLDQNLPCSMSPDSNTITAENFSQEPKKKKRKKKKSLSGNVTNLNQNIVSQNQKFKNKNQTKVSSGDKRLDLSNERLAAYGINPKKFKNKILYSKK